MAELAEQPKASLGATYTIARDLGGRRERGDDALKRLDADGRVKAQLLSGAKP